jgi:hypothetical protein
VLNKAWIAAALASTALLLTSCGKTPERKQAPANSAIPTQAEMDKLKGEGLKQAARDASKLELWLHYKLMQANGMEAALGGEPQAVAALTAISAAFERSVIAAGADMARLIPAAFDGSGLDAGVMGVGYGMVGGMIPGVLSGGLSDEAVAAAVHRGPIQDGANRAEITQGGMDLAMEQKVAENGLTGTVKTRIHLDACPDADGRLVVTIDSESRMSARGMGGSVKTSFRLERWLDDNARLSDDRAIDFTSEMSGAGVKGNKMSRVDHIGGSRDGKVTGEVVRDEGLSIFNLEEVKHSTDLRDTTMRLMNLVAEAMLRGMGDTAPWESGRCVDLKVRSDPARRTGARPNTAYTLYAEPRSKLDGLPARGTVTATLEGGSTLNPTGKVKADARYDYANPDKKNQTAGIAFEARSKRGVGRASLAFDTKEGGAYRIVAGPHAFTACDITKPFSHSEAAPGGKVTLSFTPADSRNGTMIWRFEGGGGVVKSSYSYTLSGPEDRMSGALRPTSGICATAGMSRCWAAKPLSSTWTRIEACEGK